MKRGAALATACSATRESQRPYFRGARIDRDHRQSFTYNLALFAGLGHLKTSEVGDVLECAVQREPKGSYRARQAVQLSKVLSNRRSESPHTQGREGHGPRVWAGAT